MGVTSRSLLLADKMICWAFVDSYGPIRITSENAVLNPGQIGHATVGDRAPCSPRHDIVDPVVEFAGGDSLLSAGDGKIVGTLVVVVRRVESPAQHELFIIAHAFDALCLGLCL